MIDLLLFALGAGFLWHGGLVVWVAPRPSQLRREKPEPVNSDQAFQIFWLDQYGWMGIALVLTGLGLLVTGWVL